MLTGVDLSYNPNATNNGSDVVACILQPNITNTLCVALRVWAFAVGLLRGVTSVSLVARHDAACSVLSQREVDQGSPCSSCGRASSLGLLT